MDKLGMDLDDDFSSDKQENPQESLCQAFQAMLTMNQIQETMPAVQEGVQTMPVHQPQVANTMNMQPPRPAGQVQYSQALQQLLQTLKSPNNPQKQQEVISILKAYPQLMVAFIKFRSQQGLKQQQLQQLQKQHHQNPALQMPSMQQQHQQQPQNFNAQQEMLWRQRLQQQQQQQVQQQQQQCHQNPALQMPGMQQQPQQQPQGCCAGLSEFQAHGSVYQAQNSGQGMSPLQ